MDNSTLSHTCVSEFISTFEPPSDPSFWKKLVDEELAELEEAAQHFLKEYADVLYVFTGYTQSLRDSSEFDKEHYAFFTSKLTMIFSILEELHQDHSNSSVLASVIRKVHASNMSKVGDDGKPMRHPETGKILKGPNYKPPHIDIHELYRDLTG